MSVLHVIAEMVSRFQFFILLFAMAQGQNNVHFLPESSMITKNRDGIIIVSLSSGINATVCNYGFTDQYASIACNAMGYPMKGISVLSKKIHLVKNMKMVSIKCLGTERDLKACTMVTDGRLLRNCEEKSRVAHVLCLEDKIKPIVQTSTAFTQCDKIHDRVQLTKIPGKKNIGFLKIRETNANSFRFVCNQYLNFGLAQAQLFCDLLCHAPMNPRIIMYLNPGSISNEDGYFQDMSCPDDATSLEQCTDVNESRPCQMAFNVALQCGEEIKKPDPPPNVMCSNRSMIIEWTKDQSFFLNSTLVSLHSNHTKDCLYTRTESKENVIVKIPLDYCEPIITDHDESITFKYILERLYVNDGIVQFKTKESMEVFCQIPKLDQIAKEYAHGDITYPPVLSDTILKVVMTLHTGPNFQKLLPRPYDISFYTPVFVKVKISNPLSQIKLSLRNCFVSSAGSYSDITALNSAKIIDENCPIEKYSVQIIPVNKWSIAFQFISFKLAESNKASVNIFCETIKCMVTNDPDCGVCKIRSLRKKRSAFVIESDLIIAGPIALH